jgi:ribosomal-protein-alanine N-acetyltransferase
MPLDPMVKQLLDLSAGAPPVGTVPVEVMREGAPSQMAVWFQMGLVSTPVATVEDRVIPGHAGDLPVRVYTPAGREPFPLVLYFHGGGWVLGNLDTHDPVCRALCAGAECVVISVGVARGAGRRRDPHPEFRGEGGREKNSMVILRCNPPTTVEVGVDEADILLDGEGSNMETNNLRLITVERVHVEALLRNERELAAILGVSVPDGWPHFPEAFSLPAGGSQRSERPPTDWPGYFFIHPRERALVGNGGFTGEPDDSGVVEIGYEIAPEHRNRGFATEAARAMIDYAFAHEEVRAVVAHTLAETSASNSVLRKVGMRFVGEGDHPEVGKTWRWRISRDEHHST